MERREFFKALPALFIAPFTEANNPPGELEERVTNTEVVLFLHSMVLENHKAHIERLDELHPSLGTIENKGEL